MVSSTSSFFRKDTIELTFFLTTTKRAVQDTIKQPGKNVVMAIIISIAQFLVMPCSHAATQKSDQVTLKDIRIKNSSSDARLTLEFDSDPSYRFFTLANPYRLVIDIRNLTWNDNKSPLPAHSGIITNLRYGLYPPDMMRIVLDLNQAIRIDKYAELPGLNGNEHGRRLYIDLTASDSDKGQRFTSVNWPTTAPISSPPNPKLPDKKKPNPAEPKKRVIVLDPGHGGVDPGSISFNNLYEKDIVFRFAKMSKQKLEATERYRVILTRTKDIYIPLRDRYKVAERNDADLFVSIHADKLHDASIRGASVYTLSDRASDAESATLAAQENRSDILTGHALDVYSPDVSSILIDLAQEATNRQSWRLAETLLKSYPRSIKLVGKPHRYAGFAVLKSPNVPSILVELGFMSSPVDTKLLSGATYPKQFASTLLKALDSYFNEE